MSFWSVFAARYAVLGMNARNLHYVRPLNRARARYVADHKDVSKRVLERAGVPVPRLLGRIRSVAELEAFDWASLPSSFVVKPNRGFGGGGIKVLFGRAKGRSDAWVTASRAVLASADLAVHMREILEGHFSLAGTPDTVIIEERLTLLKLFRPYAYRGIPDVRVIVYNGVPVMAMLRLPTRESDGKANLQQGAVGVGIDIARGITTTAIQGKGKVIEYAPGTRMLLSGIRIPHWDEILRLSVVAQRASGLGFLGADVAIDRERGPVFLELNARPGLSIQIANMAGLKGRLERVADLKIKTVRRGIAVGKNLFGGEIEEEIEGLSGKRVIGGVEKVTFTGVDGQEIIVEAKVDTGAHSSSIDRQLARDLGFGATLDAFDVVDLSPYRLEPENEETIKRDIMRRYGHVVPGLADVAVVFAASGASIRPVVALRMTIDTVGIDAKVNIVDRGNLTYPAIVGKRNLRKFLVDVSK